MNISYKFYNASLEPRMFEELASELFAGQTISRQNLITTVRDYHAKNGGLPHKGKDIVSAAKKAIRYLREAGKVESAPGKGMWRFTDAETTTPVPVLAPVPEPAPITEPQPTIRKLPDYPIYGTGKDTVYLFAFEEDIKEDGDFACKIGRTAGHNPESRIRAQTVTGSYKKAKLILAIHTDIADLLETSFHATLKVQGRWIQTNENKEWFMTRLSQVLGIYYSNLASTLPPVPSA